MENNFLKKFEHNLLKSEISQNLLGILSKFFLIVNTKKGEKTVAITVDTESGFLDKNNARVWMKDKPDAFVGYINGVKNIMDLGDKYNVKFTFLLSTQCFSAPKNVSEKICKAINEAYCKGHEIGLHLHPKEDTCLQNFLDKKLQYTASSFYEEEEIDSMIKASKEIIKNYLGKEIHKNLKSFRWANWALDERVFSVLERNGFYVDSSICPRIKGHMNDDRKYDWTGVRTNYPFSITDTLLEVPITTFWFLGNKRTDPIWGELLFECTRKASQIVVMTHTSECTYSNGKPTYVLDNLEKFIITAKKNNFQFLTLKEIKERGI